MLSPATPTAVGAAPTESAPTDPATTRRLTRLLFTVFAFVTDGDKDITPHEVRALQGMAANTRWTAEPLLRQALEPLRADYKEFWAGYEAGTLAVNAATIAEDLAQLCPALPPARTEALLVALSHFVERFERAGSSYLPWNNSASGGTRLQNRRIVQELLSERRRASRDIAVPVADTSPAGSTAAAATPLASAAKHASPLAALPVWNRGRRRMRCIGVCNETADVKSFTFVALEPCLFSFNPGQFVTLEVPIDGKVVRRSYTISSSPSRPFQLSVTVKRNPDGHVSAWLHDNLHEGVEIDVNGPHGNFSCLDHPADRLLLLSAGSGVTPMMSMLRFLADTAPQADIAFVARVRTPADVIFERELLHLSAQLGESLRLLILPSRVNRGQGWNGPVGPLDATLLQALVPDLRERETFVCGPQGFMDGMRQMLGGLGYPMLRFHQESFGPPPGPRKAAVGAAPAGITAQPAATPPIPPVAVPPAVISSFAIPAAAPVSPQAGVPALPLPPMAAAAPALPFPAAAAPVPAAVPSGGVTVAFARSGRSLAAAPGDVLLDIAEANGVSMDCSCRAGACGTCRVRITAGVAQMDAQNLLDEEEIAQGYVLACIARATENITVDA